MLVKKIEIFNHTQFHLSTFRTKMSAVVTVESGGYGSQDSSAGGAKARKCTKEDIIKTNDEIDFPFAPRLEDEDEVPEQKSDSSTETVNAVEEDDCSDEDDVYIVDEEDEEEDLFTTLQHEFYRSVRTDRDHAEAMLKEHGLSVVSWRFVDEWIETDKPGIISMLADNGYTFEKACPDIVGIKVRRGNVMMMRILFEYGFPVYLIAENNFQHGFNCLYSAMPSLLVSYRRLYEILFTGAPIVREYGVAGTASSCKPDGCEIRQDLLSLAVESREVPIVRMMLIHGCKVDRDVFIGAVVREDVEIVRMMLQNGCNVGYLLPIANNESNIIVTDPEMLSLLESFGYGAIEFSTVCGKMPNESQELVFRSQDLMKSIMTF